MKNLLWTIPLVGLNARPVGQQSSALPRMTRLMFNWYAWWQRGIRLEGSFSYHHKKTTVLHCKAILGPGQPGLLRWILLWIMPLVEDQLLDLLTSSPAHHDWATVAPSSPIIITEEKLLFYIVLFNCCGPEWVWVFDHPLSCSCLSGTWDDRWN